MALVLPGLFNWIASYVVIRSLISFYRAPAPILSSWSWANNKEIFSSSSSDQGTASKYSRQDDMPAPKTMAAETYLPFPALKPFDKEEYCHDDIW